MTLQRGDEIRGWEGVTRGLATNSEERNAWKVSTLGLLLIAFITGMVALLLSQSDIPSIAKAIMTGLALIGTIVLSRSIYSKLVAHAQTIDRKAAEDARTHESTPRSAPLVAPKAQPEAAAAPKPVSEPIAAAVEPEPAADVTTPESNSRPKALSAPREGDGDDLTLIKGIGPALKTLCNKLGFWHFDQIAAWSESEVAWVDENLEGFKGRVTRDDWVAQAKTLAAGGETEFSKRQ